MGKYPLFLWPFSIAMFNYQRVYGFIAIIMISLVGRSGSIAINVAYIL
jgi:hypothetical protein